MKRLSRLATMLLFCMGLATQIPLARAQATPSGQARITLEELEQMALANNPTLAQASAEIRAAEGRKRQAGLYPNPTVGYIGEQIATGPSRRGGEQGFFVRQDVVLGGKLGLSRKVFQQEEVQAQQEAEEQRFRVINAVRLGYFQALAAQEMVELRQKLARLAEDAVATSKQLYNVGQADQPDVLEAEVEAQQAQLNLLRAQQNQQRAWRALVAVVGRPEVPPTVLAGNLEEGLPDVDQDQLLQALLRDSPAIKIAQAGVKRAEYALARARREPIPDLQLRGGLQQNRELSEITARPVGLQGFAEVGVQIPVFNRNQGTVQAVRSELERSQQEVRRVELLLRERAASFLQNYLTSRDVVERYRTQMIPRAQKAYELYLKKYKEMGAAYPQVLIAQRSLFQLQTDYITGLEGLWANATILKGFLLSDGLEAPARPGEMDRPVREINVPSTGSTRMEGRP